jgi:hypothetical protein
LEGVVDDYLSAFERSEKGEEREGRGARRERSEKGGGARRERSEKGGGDIGSTRYDARRESGPSGTNTWWGMM